MPDPILVDTGPLVALLRQDDAHHQSCVAQAKKLPKGHLTCWPVITEAAWLLRKQPGGVQGLFRLVQQGVVRITELDSNAPAWIAAFLERYAFIGAQVADAALMFLAERDRINTVFTIDRRDFSIYRLSDDRILTLIP